MEDNMIEIPRDEFERLIRRDERFNAIIRVIGLESGSYISKSLLEMLIGLEADNG